MDLWNPEAVAKSHTDLRGRQALLGELADMVTHVFSLHLHPRGRAAAVRDGRRRNAFALAVHSTHRWRKVDASASYRFVT